MEVKKIGIVGGLGPLAGADVLLKLVKTTPARYPGENYDISMEQHPFHDQQRKVGKNYDPRPRKFYVYNTIKEFEKRDIDIVLLTCFTSHTFIDELQSEVKPKILSILDALRWHIYRHYPDVSRVGILTSTYAQKKFLFETKFPTHGLLYPSNEGASKSIAKAIYGPEGIKAGNQYGRAVELITEACQDLVAQGAELIVPGFTELPIVLDKIQPSIEIPILDSNQIYADYAIDFSLPKSMPQCRLGIIGGVGPAATVDFMNKVIALTDANKDQEHIKMLVEHNPQIPDRTDNLLNGGMDPTIAMFAACKKLESGGAHMIAIPCNTAHAYVDQIQMHISIPIVNMLRETVQFIQSHHPTCNKVGLLATSGTIESGIYSDVIADAGMSVVVPDMEQQTLVMESIYGKTGVKSGYTDGICRDQLVSALEHLVTKGAHAVILGCTELPLILPEMEEYEIAEQMIPLLDPTRILARKCVNLAWMQKKEELLSKLDTHIHEFEVMK